MKTKIAFIVGVFLLSTNIFADLGKGPPGCTIEIRKKAVQAAEAEFSGVCSSYQPTFKKTDSEAGTVAVICHHHISAISVTSRVYLFDFSTDAACSDVRVKAEDE